MFAVRKCRKNMSTDRLQWSCLSSTSTSNSEPQRHEEMSLPSSMQYHHKDNDDHNHSEHNK